MGFFKTIDDKAQAQSQKMFDKQAKLEEQAKEQTYEKYKSEIDSLLLVDEVLEDVYPLIIDYLCITNKRIIFVDKEIHGETEIVSVPFKNISDVSLNKGKILALTNQLKIRTRGKDHELKFIKGRNVLSIYNQIVSKII